MDAETETIPKLLIFNDSLNLLRQFSFCVNETIVDSVTMSTLCPVSMSRLTIPCRHAKCTHASCFDFFSMKCLIKKTSKGKALKCPICNDFINPNKLYVDFIVLCLLHIFRSETQIIIYENGFFGPYTPQSMKLSYDDCCELNILYKKYHTLSALGEFPMEILSLSFPSQNVDVISFHTLSYQPSITEVVAALNSFPPSLLIEMSGLGPSLAYTVHDSIVNMRPFQASSYEELMTKLLQISNLNISEASQIMESLQMFITNCSLRSYITASEPSSRLRLATGATASAVCSRPIADVSTDRMLSSVEVNCHNRGMEATTSQRSTPSVVIDLTDDDSVPSSTVHVKPSAATATSTAAPIASCNDPRKPIEHIAIANSGVPSTLLARESTSARAVSIPQKTKQQQQQQQQQQQNMRQALFQPSANARRVLVSFPPVTSELESEHPFPERALEPMRPASEFRDVETRASTPSQSATTFADPSPVPSQSAVSLASRSALTGTAATGSSQKLNTELTVKSVSTTAAAPAVATALTGLEMVDTSDHTSVDTKSDTSHEDVSKLLENAKQGDAMLKAESASTPAPRVVPKKLRPPRPHDSTTTETATKASAPKPSTDSSPIQVDSLNEEKPTVSDTDVKIDTKEQIATFFSHGPTGVSCSSGSLAVSAAACNSPTRTKFDSCASEADMHPVRTSSGGASSDNTNNGPEDVNSTYNIDIKYVINDLETEAFPGQGQGQGAASHSADRTHVLEAGRGRVRSELFPAHSKLNACSTPLNTVQGINTHSAPGLGLTHLSRQTSHLDSLSNEIHIPSHDEVRHRDTIDIVSENISAHPGRVDAVPMWSTDSQRMIFLRHDTACGNPKTKPKPKPTKAGSILDHNVQTEKVEVPFPAVLPAIGNIAFRPYLTKSPKVGNSGQAGQARHGNRRQDSDCRSSFNVSIPQNQSGMRPSASTSQSPRQPQPQSHPQLFQPNMAVVKSPTPMSQQRDVSHLGIIQTNEGFHQDSRLAAIYTATPQYMTATATTQRPLPQTELQSRKRDRVVMESGHQPVGIPVPDWGYWARVEGGGGKARAEGGGGGAASGSASAIPRAPAHFVPTLPPTARDSGRPGAGGMSVVPATLRSRGRITILVWGIPANEDCDSLRSMFSRLGDVARVSHKQGSSSCLLHLDNERDAARVLQALLSGHVVCRGSPYPLNGKRVVEQSPSTQNHQVPIHADSRCPSPSRRSSGARATQPRSRSSRKEAADSSHWFDVLTEDLISSSLPNNTQQNIS